MPASLGRGSGGTVAVWLLLLGGLGLSSRPLPLLFLTPRCVGNLATLSLRILLVLIFDIVHELFRLLGVLWKLAQCESLDVFLVVLNKFWELLTNLKLLRVIQLLDLLAQGVFFGGIPEPEALVVDLLLRRLFRLADDFTLLLRIGRGLLLQFRGRVLLGRGCLRHWSADEDQRQVLECLSLRFEEVAEGLDFAEISGPSRREHVELGEDHQVHILDQVVRVCVISASFERHLDDQKVLEGALELVVLRIVLVCRTRHDLSGFVSKQFFEELVNGRFSLLDLQKLL